MSGTFSNIKNLDSIKFRSHLGENKTQGALKIGFSQHLLCCVISPQKHSSGETYFSSSGCVVMHPNMYRTCKCSGNKTSNEKRSCWPRNKMSTYISRGDAKHVVAMVHSISNTHHAEVSFSTLYVSPTLITSFYGSNYCIMNVHVKEYTERFRHLVTLHQTGHEMST